jgi:hypothetical protein
MEPESKFHVMVSCTKARDLRTVMKAEWILRPGLAVHPPKREESYFYYFRGPDISKMTVSTAKVKSLSITP